MRLQSSARRSGARSRMALLFRNASTLAGLAPYLDSSAGSSDVQLGSGDARRGEEIALRVDSDCLSLAYALDPLSGVTPPAKWAAVVNASDRELLRVVSVGGKERRLHARCAHVPHTEKPKRVKKASRK